MAKTEDEVVAFGKTEGQIIALTEALARQTDSNHPTKSGTYTDFLNAVDTGREMLKNHKSYGKKQ